MGFIKNILYEAHKQALVEVISSDLAYITDIDNYNRIMDNIFVVITRNYRKDFIEILDDKIKIQKLQNGNTGEVICLLRFKINNGKMCHILGRSRSFYAHTGIVDNIACSSFNIPKYTDIIMGEIRTDLKHFNDKLDVVGYESSLLLIPRKDFQYTSFCVTYNFRRHTWLYDRIEKYKW